MNYVSKFSYGALVYFLLFNSCTTSEDEDHSDPNFLNAKNQIIPNNNENEFDFAGEHHNSKLIVFVDDYLLRDSIQSSEDVFNYFEASPKLSEIILAHDEMFRDDPIEFERICSDVYNADPIIHEYFKNLQGIAEASNSTLEQKLEGIREFEHDFEYENYPTNIQECLKSMSSVARFSLLLWAPINEGGSGYFDILGANLSKAPINWWRVGVDDIYGSCIGAMTTGNPLVALGGGVVTSGLSAFSQWYN